MMEQIKLYLFVLSLVFCLRFVFEFIFKLTQETPTPLTLNKYQEGILYFAISYIITYFLI